MRSARCILSTWVRRFPAGVLVLAMLLATIPGWLFSPFSINVFDEPYQILNALDWEGSVYSPLSSWLAHWFGVIFNWRYLAFRRLALILHFSGLLACALYALRISTFKTRIILFSAASALAMSLFPIYGWDSWTICFVCLSLVACLSLYRNFSYRKVVLVSVLVGVTSLMRITNISVIPISVFIVFLAAKNHNGTLRDYTSCLPGFLTYPWLVALCSLIVSILVTLAVICFLYGNPEFFIQTIKENRIGSHSFESITLPFFRQFLIVVVLAALYFLWFRVLRHFYGRSFFLAVVIASGVVMILCKCILTPSKGYYVMMQLFCLGGVLLAFIYMLRESRKGKQGIVATVMIMFLLSLVPAIGSNCGYWKVLAWPLVPLIVAFIGRSWNIIMSYFSVVWYATVIVIACFSITRGTFLDEGLFKLNYRMDEATVFEGMITTKERGSLISTVYSDIKPYIDKNYRILPLKEGNNYMWEYLTLSRNTLQRHNFSDWYAFWNQKYIDGVRRKIRQDNRPILVMYMQFKDPENPSPMYLMLNEEAECVIDRPGYSFWKRE